MPFQKGPCGEGGRMRGFLLPLLVVVVVGLVLFLLILVLVLSPLLSQHQSKQNNLIKKLKKEEASESKLWFLDGGVVEEVSGREAAKNRWYYF